MNMMWKIYLWTVCFILLITSSVSAKETKYFALYLEDSRCGYAEQTREVKGEKIISKEKIYLELSRLGVSIKLTVTETAIESPSGQPLGFKLEQDMSVMKMIVEGHIRPDGIIDIETTNAGNTVKTESVYPQGALMSEGLQILCEKYGLEPGTTYSADVFSPSLMQAHKTTFNVGGREKVDLLGRVVELVEIKGDFEVAGAGITTFTSYVDNDYVPQKMIIPMVGMNIVMIACAEEFAKSGLEAKEMISAMILKSPEKIHDVSNAGMIKYTFKPNTSNKQLQFPSTDNQQAEVLDDGLVSLIVKPVTGDPEVFFPYNGSDSQIIKALENTPFLQAAHPEIISLAKESVKGKKNALEAAKAIEAFVGTYIDSKDLSVGYASALEVARNRQGDCTEHAVLTAALCRAAGIPAQVVFGVAYVDDFLGSGYCFGGHAWTQAYIGDKWIGLDASFKGAGLAGYDAGHIALAISNGEPGDFFGVASVLGDFSIEKIEVDF
jgi:hypothetical protein